jgi:hypothetical protein
MASQIERFENAVDQVENIGVHRTNDVDDAVESRFPVAPLLVLGAVVIGGGILVAAMLRHDGPEDGLGEFRRPRRLSAAVSGVGPRVAETLGRVRDAAISFALTKAIDTVDDIFPGFRDHYERT